ncbi:serine hydrolase domain-containing protein [Ilyomonas limi]|nr:serine hydrolase domain-containing protein [Ilyomonas limi]
MKKLLAGALLLIYTQLLHAQDSTTQKLDALITVYANLGRFNGSALVAAHGKILLQKGYGLKNADSKSMNDANTVFQIASITKTFTSTVVLKLVEEHKLSLDDKLSKFYSGFPNGDTITIQELLSHTSGLHNFTEEDTTINETDEQRMIPYLKTLKPDFAPGTNWSYSNSGYVVLGYIIQKVSGMSYWQAVRKYIFEPLHMNNSGFDFTHLKSADKAIGYDVLNDSVQQQSTITDSTVPFGAGAIYSTVTDMYNWNEGLKSYKIVHEGLMQQAYTPCALHNYGFGWQIDSIYGRKMLSHSGAISGFGSNFARIPGDDVCIVLLSNISGSAGSTFNVTHLTDKLLAILYHKAYTIPKKKTPVAVNKDVLKNYTGTYTIDEMNLRIDVTVGDDILIAQPYRDGHPGPTSFLHPLNNTQFYDERDDDLEVTLDVDATGKPNGMKILQAGITRYAKKIK